MRFKGLSGVAIRDLTDVAHPVTRCVFSGGEFFRFVSPTRVSYVMFAAAPGEGPQTGWQQLAGAMYLADLNRRTTSLVRTWSYTDNWSWLYAWSPDGATLAYVKVSADYRFEELHLLTSTEDRTVAHVLPTALPYPACWPGFQTSGDAVAFSADGKYVAIALAAVYAEVHIVRVADGTDVMSDRVDLEGTAFWAVPAHLKTSASPWPTWLGSGSRLLFQTAPTTPRALKGWSAGSGLSTVEPTLQWATPWPSADGNRVVYARFGASTDPLAWATDWTPWMLDLSSGTPVERQLSTSPRYGTAFLTSTLIWYARPQASSSDTCIGAGQGYVYDLSDDAETPSVITGVFDSWPHVGGQT